MKAQPSNPKQRMSKASFSQPNYSNLVLPVVSLVGCLGLLWGVQNVVNSFKYPLRGLELKDVAGLNAKKARHSKSPKYGLKDVRVPQNQNQVYIVLRDIGSEDGDIVTLKVNGQVIAANVFLRNGGNSVPVNVRPGANLVEIYGVRDGVGGITLAADVSTQGNMTNTPFPPGATASFYIVR
ncbi:MAG: hypothetical protein QNJ54_31675 [Prochloraceae cyanobacterium]|nr:hypothetical protein [Prochloraceae cyanobacterium]